MELSDLWKKSTHVIKTMNDFEECLKKYGGVWKIYSSGHEMFVLKKNVEKDTVRAIYSLMAKNRLFYPESKVEVKQ